MKKVLVACEFSQHVTAAFLSAGCDAYSCDIISCKGNFPERHLLMDAREAVRLHDWDLIIAHPPCTYLCVVSWVNSTKPSFDMAKQLANMSAARDFFYFFYNLDSCPVCIENPRPLHRAALPPYDQVINPYDFGDIYSKRTCLWLKDLPPLLPTTCKPLNVKSFTLSRHGGKARSVFSPYISEAMASQWASLI